MPTGYTASVADGDVTEFPEFAMRCARAFGALITMRDDPNDASIPDEFTPDSHHQRALDNARTSLAVAREWDEPTAARLAEAAHADAVRVQRELAAADKEKRQRYEAMLTEVRAWRPPTPDHDEMKKFMINQLEESIRFDCGHTYKAPPVQTAEDFRAQKIASALHDIEYHAKQLAEDYERVRKRTEWVRALRQSLDNS